MCKSLYTYLTICFAFEKPRWLLHNTADRVETVFSHLNNSQYSAFFRANEKKEKLRPKPKYWRDYLWQLLEKHSKITKI